MGAFESILELARTLTDEDRVRLARLLLQKQEPADGEHNEIAAGERGLHSWTESARGDDWTEFCPVALRQKRVG